VLCPPRALPATHASLGSIPYCLSRPLSSILGCHAHTPSLSQPTPLPFPISPSTPLSLSPPLTLSPRHELCPWSMPGFHFSFFFSFSSHGKELLTVHMLHSSKQGILFILALLEFDFAPLYSYQLIIHGPGSSSELLPPTDKLEHNAKAFPQSNCASTSCTT
jgi:hypothetical protein